MKWWIAFLFSLLPLGLVADSSSQAGDLGTSWQQEVEPVPLEFPHSSESLSMGKAVLRMLAFFAALGTIGGTIVLLKKRGRLLISRRNPSSIRVLETVSLGSKFYLAVVEYKESRFLVGVSPQSITKISDL